MIMEMFEHENVLSLIGISFEADNLPMIITPIMTKGDLLTYIRHPQNWSYGVVVWELCTRGKIPYAGRSGFEVLSYLKSGHQLERFDTTPEEVDEMMRACWMLPPDERPDFTTLVDRLPEVIDQVEDHCFTSAALLQYDVDFLISL